MTVFNTFNTSSSIPSSIPSSKHSFFDTFFPSPAPITKQLQQFAENSTMVWSKERQRTVLEALKHENYYRCRSYLKTICLRLSDKQLHQLIKSTSHIDINAPHAQSSNSSFNKLTGLLTLDQIEAAMRTEFSNFSNALEQAKELSSSAKYYLELVHPSTIKYSLNSFFTNVIWAIDNLIETILITFGLNEFQDDNLSEYKTTYRLQLLLSAFSALSALVTIAVSLTGSAALGLTIVGSTVITGGVLLAIYLRYLKPAPRKIKGCRNLTSEAIAGVLPDVKGRQHHIDEIAKSLIASSSGTKTHPLLIGPSGVGKTEIIHGFAHAVAAGRYPSLIGKQVFYINTADLIAPSNRGSWYDSPLSLEKLKEKIQYRRHDVILIFDEFHESCKGEKSQGNLAERLKTLLDNGPDSFPYVVAATTDKEFDTHIKPNDALARRFKHISIQETSKVQTLAILKKKLLAESCIYATEDAIEAVYDLSHKNLSALPQPYMSCRILAQAVLKARETGASKIHRQIEEEEAAIETLLSSRLLGRGADSLYGRGEAGAHKEYQQRMDRLDLLKVQLEEEHGFTKIFESMVNALERAKEKALELSLKISQSPKTQIGSLKEFALISYQLQALNEALHAFTYEKGKPMPIIDCNLVKQVIDDELKLKFPAIPLKA